MLFLFLQRVDYRFLAFPELVAAPFQDVHWFGVVVVLEDLYFAVVAGVAFVDYFFGEMACVVSELGVFADGGERVVFHRILAQERDLYGCHK